MLMAAEKDNLSDNFWSHEDENPTFEKPDIEEDDINLAGQSSDTGNRIWDMLSRRTSQAGLLESHLTSFGKEVRFSNEEFAGGTIVFNIKYNYLEFQNNNPFYPFHDQLDYGLAKYFAKFKTTKSNIDKFLSKPLITPLTENLSYKNVNKWMKNFEEFHGIY